MNNLRIKSGINYCRKSIIKEKNQNKDTQNNAELQDAMQYKLYKIAPIETLNTHNPPLYELVYIKTLTIELAEEVLSLEMTEDRESSSWKLEMSEDKSRYGTSKRGLETTSDTLDLLDRGEDEISRTINTF
jgi:hypothetical protein